MSIVRSLQADLYEMLHRECETFLQSYPFDRVTPGGVVGIGWTDEVFKEDFIYCFGRTERTEHGQKVIPETIYDLASLTKPLVTVPAIMSLVQRGELSLSMRLDQLFSLTDLAKPNREITIRQLLSHSSGFCAHKNLFVQALSLPARQRKQHIYRLIRNESTSENRGSHCYSDLGFILLGEIIEKITGQSLQCFFEDEIAQPLGISSQLYFPDHDSLSNNGQMIAPTEVCPWTHKMLRGVVHDDNCRVLGGVAGHAGLFGTIRGVLHLTGTLAELWKGKTKTTLFSAELLRTFTTRENNSTWSLGFDSPSKSCSSSGRYFSEATIGHLGYTGTSFWIDLARGITVVLLTNRVNPTRKNEMIRQFRPQIHDRIMNLAMRR